MHRSFQLHLLNEVHGHHLCSEQFDFQCRNNGQHKTFSLLALKKYFRIENKFFGFFFSFLFIAIMSLQVSHLHVWYNRSCWMNTQTMRILMRCCAITNVPRPLSDSHCSRQQCSVTWKISCRISIDWACLINLSFYSCTVHSSCLCLYIKIYIACRALYCV